MERKTARERERERERDKERDKERKREREREEGERMCTEMNVFLVSFSPCVQISLPVSSSVFLDKWFQHSKVFQLNAL